ncbi:MAG TPA: hypothetical protein VIL20_25590 [Sandaracinaceae bacterium]
MRVVEEAPGRLALSLRENGDGAGHCPIDELERSAGPAAREALDAARRRARPR